MWRSLLGLGAALALFGCTPSSALVVELRTDMHPGIEFVEVETALYAGTSLDAFDVPREVSPAVDLSGLSSAFDGVRVAELIDVPAGDYLVRVQLLDGRRAVVGTGIASVVMEGESRSISVLVTRRCANVECPGSGSATELACLAGRCVDPGCLEDPSRCPPAECAGDADCPGGPVACARGRCLAGFCVVVGDDAACGGGRCDVGSGCLGAPDAGPDAGLDGGPPDAGVDAGVDGGPPDAGRPCVPLVTFSQNISYDPIGIDDPVWAPPVVGSCPGTASGQTPYFDEIVYCNAMSVPYGFTLEIVDHPVLTDVANQAIWGYAGDGAPTDPNDCTWSVAGIGAVTPEVNLAPGERFTIRIGSRDSGATGAFAVTYTPR